MNKRTKIPPQTQAFVAYYRVSTKKQSAEMPAQKTAVKKYLGPNWPPKKTFIEIESGKTDHNRPELHKALEYCYEHKATLIVAKLDRLSRDLEFIGWIQNTPIDFVCCDMPQATRETIGFMGVMARWEREQIAKRTKEALAEKKKQGVKLGFHNPKVKKGVLKYWKQYKKDKAKFMANNPPPTVATVNTPKPTKKPSKREQYDKQVWPIIKILRTQNYTFKEIARILNETPIPTRQNKRWHVQTVFRVAERNY